MGGRQNFYGSKGGPPDSVSTDLTCSANHLAKRASRFHSTAASELESPAFSLREVKTLIQDLFPPKPSVYWGDLFLSVFVAYGLAATSNQNPMHLWLDAKVEP